MFHSPAGVRRTLAAALAVASCSAVGFAAQTAAPPYRVGWGDAASITAAATIALLGARTTPPLSTGAPCDRADLPGIDRRTVDLRSGFARSASDVALVGVTGGATRNSLLLLGGATGVGACGSLEASISPPTCWRRGRARLRDWVACRAAPPHDPVTS